VNSGPPQSAKWLQRALGTVKVDGVIGEATLAALEAHRDHDALIADILKRRMEFLKALRTWKSFGRGWTARVTGVRKLGQAWASGSVGPQPVFTDGGNAKATIEQAKAPASPAGGDAAIGSGGATVVLGGALKQAQDALAPLSGSGGWIDGVVVALIITGALITIGGIAWRLHARRKAAKQTDALDLAVPA
jgi:lysozyme family protein